MGKVFITIMVLLQLATLSLNIFLYIKLSKSWDDIELLRGEEKKSFADHLECAGKYGVTRENLWVANKRLLEIQISLNKTLDNERYCMNQLMLYKTQNESETTCEEQVLWLRTAYQSTLDREARLSQEVGEYKDRSEVLQVRVDDLNAIYQKFFKGITEVLDKINFDPKYVFVMVLIILVSLAFLLLGYYLNALYIGLCFISRMLLSLGSTIIVHCRRVLAAMELRRGAQHMEDISFFEQEANVESAPLFPVQDYPGCQLMVVQKKSDGSCVSIGNAFAVTTQGCLTKKTPVLVFADHVIKNSIGNLYLMKPGTSGLSLLLDRTKLRPIDGYDVSYLDLKDIKQWSVLGVQNYRLVGLETRKIATLVAMGKGSNGVLSPDPTMVGSVIFEGSSHGGFSGAPYFLHKQVFGLHIGSTKSWGMGIESSFLDLLIETDLVRRNSPLNEDTIEVVMDEILKRGRKQQKFLAATRGDDVFVKYNNRYYNLALSEADIPEEIFDYFDYGLEKKFEKETVYPTSIEYEDSEKASPFLEVKPQDVPAVSGLQKQAKSVQKRKVQKQSQQQESLRLEDMDQLDMMPVVQKDLSEFTYKEVLKMFKYAYNLKRKIEQEQSCIPLDN